MMTFKQYNRKRKYALLSLLILVLVLTTVSCKRASDKSANGNSANSKSSADTGETSSTPPFPTKEPERYQATWVTSGSGGPGSATVPGISMLTNQRMPVARDGDKRRVETEVLPGLKIIYLQLPNGKFALYPAKKLYSEIKMDGSDNPMGQTQGVPSDFSPDKLIGNTPSGAKFEKLGTEEINGRMTTKYRVTSSGGDSKLASETTIWADESLGMPIKIEMTSKDGTKFGMEMRDIKLEVDPSIFDLPKDYRKVEHSELLSNALPSVKDLLGIGDEKKPTKKR